MLLGASSSGSPSDHTHLLAAVEKWQLSPYKVWAPSWKSAGRCVLASHSQPCRTTLPEISSDLREHCIKPCPWHKQGITICLQVLEIMLISLEVLQPIQPESWFAYLHFYLKCFLLDKSLSCQSQNKPQIGVYWRFSHNFLQFPLKYHHSWSRYCFGEIKD